MSQSLRQRVLGKSRAVIATLCVNVPRGDLYDLIHDLATLEVHVTDREIASRRRMGWRKVQKLMRSGDIAPSFHNGRTNPYTAPLSAVHSFDERKRVKPRPSY